MSSTRDVELYTGVGSTTIARRPWMARVAESAPRVSESPPSEEEEMTCRGSVAPADEERTLLPLVQPGSPAAALNKAGSSGKSRNAASTLGMCACALGLCALFALGLFAGKSSSTAPSAPPADAQSLGAILQKAGHRALGGGLGGAVAGACQVCVCANVTKPLTPSASPNLTVCVCHRCSRSCGCARL